MELRYCRGSLIYDEKGRESYLWWKMFKVGIVVYGESGSPDVKPMLSTLFRDCPSHPGPMQLLVLCVYPYIIRLSWKQNESAPSKNTQQFSKFINPCQSNSRKKSGFMRLFHLICSLNYCCSKIWSRDQQHWHHMGVYYKCRIANVLPTPQTYYIKISGIGPRDLCFNNLSRWFWGMLKFAWL